MNDSAQHQDMTYLERANVRRLAATILRRRAQLLEVGGNDAVVGDILELAAQTGSSHRDAATLSRLPKPGSRTSANGNSSVSSWMRTVEIFSAC